MPHARLVQSCADLVVTNMSNAREECAISQNSNYQRDIRYAFKLNSWFLGPLGIWPLTIRNIGQYVSNIAIVFYNFLLGFAIVPLLLYTICDQKGIKAKLKKCGLLTFCLTAMIKYMILIIRRPKIQLCIDYIKYDWWQVTLSDREMMLKHAVTGRNLTIIGALFMYIGGFIYFGMMIPFYTFKINNQTIRPVVYPVYSQFGDMQNSPKYEILYAIHCVCGYTMYTVTTGTCGLAALFVTHACGQFQMIISRLQNLLDESLEQTQNIHQQIAAIVKRHVRVQRFAAVVEEILQDVCLVEFSSSVCTICFVEYYCILDWHENDKVGLTSYSVFLVSLSFNVYILCYIGELLMEKSSQIGSACYMINWYEISPKLLRNIIMIIAMSSHPVKLTVGGIADLSLSTFGQVMKTSVVYLSFLRTLVII